MGVGVGFLVSLCVWKGKWKEWKENRREMKKEIKFKGKWKRNEIKEKWKEKLSDPSPFINILNNIQFLLVVVGIKHSYL